MPRDGLARACFLPFVFVLLVLKSWVLCLSALVAVGKNLCLLLY